MFSSHTAQAMQTHTIMWWQLWNFLVCQVKFNRFLYRNNLTQRIFWYLERLFESELSKIGNFKIWESIFEARFHLISLKTIFLSEYHNSWRTKIFKFKRSQKKSFNMTAQILTALTQKVLQGIKKSFEYAHWNVKVYWILLDTLWNSTTVSMLMYKSWLPIYY